MDARVYWIWLQQALGVGAPESAAVLKLCGDAQTVYDTPTAELLPTGVLPVQVKRLKNKDTTAAERQLARTLKSGGFVLTPEDVYFPDLLAAIYAPPVVLYGRGECFDLRHQLAIAVVGCRKPSHYGRLAAACLGAGLAAGGAVVVSGGADGLDTEAMNAALAAGGQCVIVQACGLDVNYPAVTADTRQRVVESGGMLLSEYPDGTLAYRGNFKIRNRLISGMTMGTCVPEAVEASGTLITAHWAREQGRDVFAVPGEMGTAYTAGNNLIKQGARLVISAVDVLEEYTLRFGQLLDLQAAAEAERLIRKYDEQQPEPPEKAPAVLKVAQPTVWLPPERPEALSDAAAAVFGVMNGTPQPVDDIAEKAGLPASVTLAALTELEMLGVARCCAGQQYALE